MWTIDWTCETLSCSLPAFSPPFFNTGNFPKEKQLSFSISKVDYHNNFLFHLRAGFFWKSLMALMSAVIVLLWLSDLQLGHTQHCETWSSVCQYLWVDKGPLTSRLLDVEAGSISPRVILMAEIWIWTGYSFHRQKINSKHLHLIRWNEKKYIIKMVISAPIAEFPLIFMTLFSEQSF